MDVIEYPDEMRAWSREQRAAGRLIGFVPTMGALHEGHASLMRESVAQNDVTVVSIFVNPTQFAPHEDFDRYPRTWDADRDLSEALGAQVVYAPSAQTMYPEKYSTYVTVERVQDHLCGASRPHFFRGVATVVAKLFNAVQPDRAYFGQKDAQQCAVIRRMVRDLDFPIEIIEMPVVREPDGLAMSSRNKYLSEDERQRALALSRGLIRGQELLNTGERDSARIIQEVRMQLADVETDYVALVDAEEMQPVATVDGAVVLAVAATVGSTRLIDNMKLMPGRSGGQAPRLL
jgi:pantoate--beta-alanine ligase